MILVTGASSGIGKRIYKYFSKRFDYQTVYGVSRRGPTLLIDLSTVKGRKALLNEVKLRGYRISCLVNNAGVLHLDESNYSECMKMVNLNLIAVWQLTEMLYPYMVDGGCIINISSVSGLNSDSDTPLYGATKAGVISLTKSYAKKFANGTPKVRVNCISPGFFDTNLVEESTPQYLIDKVPLLREAKTEEILPVVDMIMNCEYLTGANIVVDGGLSL